MTVDPFADNGEPPEKVERASNSSIEQELREAWGDTRYELSAFHALAVVEVEREQTRADFKKGKK